jgi:hypothetical protein
MKRIKHSKMQLFDLSGICTNSMSLSRTMQIHNRIHSLKNEKKPYGPDWDITKTIAVQTAYGVS